MAKRDRTGDELHALLNIARKRIRAKHSLAAETELLARITEARAMCKDEGSDQEMIAAIKKVFGALR